MKMKKNKKQKRRQQQKRVKRLSRMERANLLAQQNSAERRKARRRRQKYLADMGLACPRNGHLKEMDSACREWKFTDQAIAIAGDLAKHEPKLEEIKANMPYRQDFTYLPTITIDGADAKDLDDAIDIEVLEQGYRLYVHIADVDHYIRPHSQLTSVAYKRGNSIYLVDQVIPMLPEGLSNGICSLHEGVYRLTLTVIIDFDLQGYPVREEVCESVIRNKRRCTYDFIQSIVEENLTDRELMRRKQSSVSSQSRNADTDFIQLIKNFSSLCDLIKQRRQKQGMLEFDFPELKFQLDSDNQPLKIKQEYQSYAQSIIEMFMIEANEAIARIAVEHDLPIIFRVHEKPDRQKISELRRLVESFEVKVKLRNDRPKPIELQQFLAGLKDFSGQEVLSVKTLRALAKARYDANNLGHYGLATDYYCHFTSPIRRYSDTFTHRVIKKYLNGQKLKRERFLAPKVAEHVSKMERRAIEVERDSIAEKACVYYKKHLGDVDWGEISGFSNFAVFVRLSTGVEGSIPYRSFPKHYIYDAQLMQARCEKTGEILEYGNRLPVAIAAVNIERRFIDLELVDESLLTSSRM